MKDVQKLNQFIEDEATSADPPDNDFEVLKESPTLGDGKFKLEIGTLVHSGSENCLTLQLFSKDTCP